MRQEPLEPLPRAGILALLALGVVLRVHDFWTPDPWLDEYGTWWIASGSWSDVVRRGLARGGTWPFYHLFVKWSLTLFGPTTFALRLPSVLASLGTLGLAIPLAKNVLRDSRATCGALAAFAVSQPLIWYGQEARPYSLGLLCLMGSFLAYTALLRKERVVMRAAYVAATAATFYAHYLFGLAVVIQAVHLAWQLKGRLPRRWLLTFGALALLAMPGVGHIRALVHARQVLTFLPIQDWRAMMSVGAQLLDVRVLAITALAAFALGCRKPPRGDMALLILWFVVPLACLGLLPPLIGVSLLADTGTIHAVRYVLFGLPAALLLAGWVMGWGGCAGWRRRVPLYVFLWLALSVHLLPTLRMTGTFGTWPPEGFAQAARHMQQQIRPEDLVLFSSGYAESDLVALNSRPDSELSGYLSYPLSAHVPPALMRQVMLLPFRINQQTRAYLDRLEQAAAAHRRVWVMGQGPAMHDVLRRVTSLPGVRIEQQGAYGTVYLALFTWNGPSSAPSTNG